MEGHLELAAVESLVLQSAAISQDPQELGLGDAPLEVGRVH
jgi:hypothetical protein